MCLLFLCVLVGSSDSLFRVGMPTRPCRSDFDNEKHNWVNLVIIGLCHGPKVNYTMVAIGSHNVLKDISRR